MNTAAAAITTVTILNSYKDVALEAWLIKKLKSFGTDLQDLVVPDSNKKIMHTLASYFLSDYDYLLKVIGSYTDDHHTFVLVIIYVSIVTVE